MKQTRSSGVWIASLAVAALAAVACGRQGDASEVVGTTSLTSADLPAPSRSAENPDLVCAPPKEEPVAGVCSAPEAPSALTLAPVTLASRRRTAGPTARTPGARDARSAELDEAIRQSLEPGDHQDATPTEPEGAVVTTTSATIARPLASPVTPSPAPAAVPAAPLARVSFVNRLPGDYRLGRVRVLVDGAPAYDAATPGTVTLPPGPHAVRVVADYQLRDPIFTYVDGYGIELEATREVPATTTPVDLTAVAVPSGGVTTPMDRRAALQLRLDAR